MTNTLTIHEDTWLSDGPVYASGQVLGYRVGGWPDGRSARIANFGGPNHSDWRVMVIDINNAQAEWIGHYQNFDDALGALKQDAPRI